MSDKPSSPDPVEARNRLDKLWTQALSEPATVSVDADLNALVNSKFVSIRYCLPTQLLGKLIDHSEDCLCLQKGDRLAPGNWDPRSFCNKTIVPWVAENQAVLGSSSDPYVGKPLRKPRLEDSPGNVKDAGPWKLLFEVLQDVQGKNDPKYTEEKFIATLRCIKVRFSELTFEYFVPERISIEQTLSIVGNILAEASGGDRGLSVAAALFETIGKYFQLYSRVNRYDVNASDVATGTSADIECYGSKGDLKLAVEVKERNLTLMDIKSAIHKARKKSLREVLFNTPASKTDEEAEIQTLTERTWASGTNIYRLSIEELIKVCLSLTGEDARIYFLERIGSQLDKYNTQPANRNRWKELLDSF